MPTTNMMETSGYRFLGYEANWFLANNIIIGIETRMKTAVSHML